MAETIGAPGITTVTNEAHTLVPSAVPGKLLCTRRRDQRVLSLQPHGSQEYRDPGTDGPFEQAELVGASLVYDYTWDGVRRISKVAWVGAVDAQ